MQAYWWLLSFRTSCERNNFKGKRKSLVLKFCNKFGALTFVKFSILTTGLWCDSRFSVIKCVQFPDYQSAKPIRFSFLLFPPFLFCVFVRYIVRMSAFHHVLHQRSWIQNKDWTSPQAFSFVMMLFLCHLFSRRWNWLMVIIPMPSLGTVLCSAQLSQPTWVNKPHLANKISACFLLHY